MIHTGSDGQIRWNFYGYLRQWIVDLLRLYFIKLLLQFCFFGLLSRDFLHAGSAVTSNNNINKSAICDCRPCTIILFLHLGLALSIMCLLFERDLSRGICASTDQCLYAGVLTRFESVSQRHLVNYSKSTIDGPLDTEVISTNISRVPKYRKHGNTC